MCLSSVLLSQSHFVVLAGAGAAGGACAGACAGGVSSLPLGAVAVGEAAEEVQREGEDDGGVLLRADVVQRLFRRRGRGPSA